MVVSVRAVPGIGRVGHGVVPAGGDGAWAALGHRDVEIQRCGRAVGGEVFNL